MWLRKMSKLRRGPWLWAIAAMICIPFVAIGGLLALNSVDTSITEADRKVIIELQLDEDCHSTAGFQEELQCIKAVQ